MDVNSPEAAQWSETMRLKSENEHLRALLKDAAQYLTSAYSDEGTWWNTGAMNVVKAADGLGG